MSYLVVSSAHRERTHPPPQHTGTQTKKLTNDLSMNHRSNPSSGYDVALFFKSSTKQTRFIIFKSFYFIFHRFQSIHPIFFSISHLPNSAGVDDDDNQVGAIFKSRPRKKESDFFALYILVSSWFVLSLFSFLFASSTNLLYASATIKAIGHFKINRKRVIELLVEHTLLDVSSYVFSIYSVSRCRRRSLN